MLVRCTGGCTQLSQGHTDPPSSSPVALQLLDYNDGDAGGEQADAPADDGAALQQAAEAAAAEVVAAEEAAADGATDGAAGHDAAEGSAEVGASAEVLKAC